VFLSTFRSILVIGGILTYLRGLTESRLRTAQEVRDIGLPILGVVPRMTGRRTAVARAKCAHLDPRSDAAGAYCTVFTTLYRAAPGTRARTLLVTSPEARDGKTTSASNLAIVIAQRGRRVLLCDTDFRHRIGSEKLRATGLSNVLSGTETLEHAVQGTGLKNLFILPCGAIPRNPPELLTSQKFAEVIDQLASNHDYIIFDSPPVNAGTDSRILGTFCDATVLVLRARKSTREDAERARNALTSGARIVGAILNDAGEKPKGTRSIAQPFNPN